MQAKELTSLVTYITKNNFKGYDPYDTLNSFVPFTKLGKWPPILAIQFQKRNPVNIRPLMGIKKGHNPKAMGLFLEAFCNLYNKTQKQEYAEHAHFLFGWLKENTSDGYKGAGWGYNFPWSSPLKHLPKYSPTSVVTGFISRGVFTYYQTFKNDEAAELIHQSAEFIQEEIPSYEDESGLCFSYSTKEQDVCYNASLLAAEVLSYSYALNPRPNLKLKIEKALNFVVSRQKEDGRWNYSVDMETGKEREQIDFHQGFVLDSISIIQVNLGIEKFDFVLKKGLDYYIEHQFNDDGRSKFRIPSEWPADIHNQAQGIITIKRLWHLCSDSQKAFADEILSWTLENMRNKKKGYFHYRKYPSYSIKISYIRWAQAWMLLAMSF